MNLVTLKPLGEHPAHHLVPGQVMPERVGAYQCFKTRCGKALRVLLVQEVGPYYKRVCRNCLAMGEVLDAHTMS